MKNRIIKADRGKKIIFPNDMKNRINKTGGEKSEFTPYLPYSTQQKLFVMFTVPQKVDVNPTVNTTSRHNSC